MWSIQPYSYICSYSIPYYVSTSILIFSVLIRCGVGVGGKFMVGFVIAGAAFGRGRDEPLLPVSQRAPSPVKRGEYLPLYLFSAGEK